VVQGVLHGLVLPPLQVLILKVIVVVHGPLVQGVLGHLHVLSVEHVPPLQKASHLIGSHGPQSHFSFLQTHDVLPPQFALEAGHIPLTGAGHCELTHGPQEHPVGLQLHDPVPKGQVVAPHVGLVVSVPGVKGHAAGLHGPQIHPSVGSHMHVVVPSGHGPAVLGQEPAKAIPHGTLSHGPQVHPFMGSQSHVVLIGQDCRPQFGDV
jgi:hypothetical protein